MILNSFAVVGRVLFSVEQLHVIKDDSEDHVASLGFSRTRPDLWVVLPTTPSLDGVLFGDDIRVHLGFRA